MAYQKIQLSEAPEISQFFAYIHERHSIWYRRFVEKKPPPWTEEPILQKFRFCNVYRELDYGTVWSIENVIKPRELKPESTVLGVVAYRCCNNPKTFEDNGLPHRKTDVNKFIRALERYQAEGNPVFSPAYRASAFGPTPRLEIYRRILTEAQRDLKEMVSLLRLSEGLKNSWKIFNSRWGIGPFLAYEIMSDLMYSTRFRKNFTFDDFVVSGPGAQYGLEMMFGKLTNREALEKIYWLRDVQGEYLSSEFNGPRLTAANIEDNLCEFRKLVSIQNGGGRPRIFEPRREPVRREPVR